MSKESKHTDVRQCIFRETFNDEESVRDNGMSLTNVARITNGVLYTNGTNTQITCYKPFSSGVYSIRIKFASIIPKTDSTLIDFRYSSGTGFINSSAIPNTLSPSSGTTYVDGVATTTYTSSAKDIIVTGISLNQKVRFTLGTNFLYGSTTDILGIELVEIYNYALSANEVKNLYENKSQKDVKLDKTEQLGPELVVNGGFDTDTDWVKGVGWTITPGKLIATGGISTTSSQASTTAIGKTYRVDINIAARSAGNCNVQIGNYSVGRSISSAITTTGIFTFYLEHVAGASVINITGVGFTGEIDSISVKEVLVNPTKTILDVCCGVNRLSGNTINGSLVPSVVNTAVSIVKDGDRNVMSFNGSTSKLDCGSYDTLIGDKTFIAWVNTKGWATIGEGRILDNGKVFMRTLPSYYRLTSDGSTYASSATSVISISDWQFLVVTRTSTGITNFYLDGVANGTANQSSGTPTVGTANITIGNRSTSDRQHKGLLDKVRVVDGLLSSAEIQQLFSNERKNFNG